jgi:hypothetical protein
MNRRSYFQNCVEKLRDYLMDKMLNIIVVNKQITAFFI